MLDTPNKHKTPQQWQAILDDFARSGLKQSAYCKLHGIPSSTFSQWKHKLNKPLAEANPGSSQKPSSLSPEKTTKLIPLLSAKSEPSASKPCTTIKAYLKNSLMLEWPEYTCQTYIANLLRALSHGI